MTDPAEARDPSGSADSERAGRMRVIAVAAVAFAVTAGLVIALDRPPPKRPNVLMLVMDTTRGDRCSFAGYARDTTPRLAEFAKDAVVFTEAWSSSNWTAPAHATLFTGLSPDSHGLGYRPGSLPGLAPSLRTLAEQFHDAGYATGCFTNNPFISPEFGLTRGFETLEKLYANEKRPYPWAPHTHELAAKWAEDAHAAGTPFFLFINDMEPHLPYTPPEADAVKFLRGAPSPEEVATARAFSPRESLAYNLGIAQVDDRQLALHADLYDAEVFSLDREIGVLLDRLRAAKILDSTLVVVLSDHGEFLGEHRIVDHGFGAYRAVLHVPLMLRLPGAFEGGRLVGDVVRLEDVAPTITQICGVAALPDVDGISLLADVSGRVAQARQYPNDFASLRAARDFPGADRARLAVGIRSVFDGRRHLVAFSDGRNELYAPATDPDEKDDLAHREPDEVSRLTRLLPAAK